MICTFLTAVDRKHSSALLPVQRFFKALPILIEYICDAVSISEKFFPGVQEGHIGNCLVMGSSAKASTVGKKFTDQTKVWPDKDRLLKKFRDNLFTLYYFAKSLGKRFSLIVKS